MNVERRGRGLTSPTVFKRVCAAMISSVTGESDSGGPVSLKRACQDCGTTVTKFLWFCNADGNEEYLEQFRRVRDVYLTALAEEIVELADNATPETANQVKVQIEARKWLVSKLLNEFKEKAQVVPVGQSEPHEVRLQKLRRIRGRLVAEGVIDGS